MLLGLSRSSSDPVIKVDKDNVAVVVSMLHPRCRDVVPLDSPSLNRYKVVHQLCEMVLEKDGLCKVTLILLTIGYLWAS